LCGDHKGNEVVWEVKIMKDKIAVSPRVLVLFIALTCYFSGFPFCYLLQNGPPSDLCAQTSQNLEPAETKGTVAGTSQEAKKSRPRVKFVKMTNFYLKDDELVFGKLVSEDKNKIIIEEADESRIVLSTYSKREIDIRTLQTKNVPEDKYYLELAEYFSGRTWDFRDDPDDFIQAIRCYEKAGRSVAETQGQDSKKIDEISQKIKELEADRRVWIREVESRARLKKLEFEAEIEKRLDELEVKVSGSSQQVDESIAKMEDNYQEIQKSISEINNNLSRQLEILAERVRTNRRLIEDISFPQRYYRRRYYP